MGYECKVYVVDAVDERWADTVAVFDLCKIGEKNLTSYRNLFTRSYLLCTQEVGKNRRRT